MVNNKVIKFIECECGGEGILVTHWTEDLLDRDVYLTLYSAGTYRNNTLSFKERILHALHVYSPF